MTVLLLALSAALSACGAKPGDSATHPAKRPAVARASAAGQNPLPPGQWALTWNSDFNGASPMKKWLFFNGGNGWGLRQLQWYDSGNAAIDSSGQLVITADANGGGNTCWYGACTYTSARMETKNTFSQKYGLFEARIKLPAGHGVWPAFWIEGDNVYQVGWPACGEIDIIEPSNRNPNLVQAYAHAPKHVRNEYLTVSDPITAGFHTYAVQWTPTGITWYFDGHAYGHMNAYKGWPFSQKFFIILDLAVGGSYPGTPNASTHFPAQMVVDWVRVYRRASGS